MQIQITLLDFERYKPFVPEIARPDYVHHHLDTEIQSKTSIKSMVMLIAGQ